MALSGCANPLVSAPAATPVPVQVAGGEVVQPQLQTLLHAATLHIATENKDLQSSDWPEFAHDAAHTGAGATMAPLQGKVAWFFPTHVPVTASPVVANGMVYFGSADGYLHALDARTGKQVWQVEIGDSLLNGTVAVNDGIVYANAHYWDLLALDALTGKQIWSFTLSDAVWAPPTVAAGVVLEPTDSNAVYALDAKTGKEFWKFQSEDAYSDFWPTGAAQAIRNNSAYISLGASTEFDALDLSTGRKQWEVVTPGRMYGGPTVDGRVVYVPTWNGEVTAFDAGTGQQYWSFILPDHRGSEAAPAVVGGVVYYGGYGGSLYALDANTGQTDWSFLTSGAIVSTPAVCGSTVYASSEDGYLYALDARAGKELWKIHLGELRSSPACAEGMLYVGSVGADGVYAIS